MAARSTLVGLRSPGARTVLVTAGFHGDEKAGPLTLLAHAAEIVGYAAARGVGLAIYPCVNPSGFEAHIRYNLSGERPNNDFLRYELSPGVWRGELREGEGFLRVVPAVEGLPKETAALARELDRLPLPAAALDLHQDNFIHGSLFYAYVFGDLAHLPAAHGARGGAGAGPAQQHRRLGARAGERRPRRRRGVHHLPRRQHHRPLPPRRRPPTWRRSRPPPRRPPRWPTRST